MCCAGYAQQARDTFSLVEKAKQVIEQKIAVKAFNRGLYMFMYECNLMSKFANKFANYQVRNEKSINMKDLGQEFENGERERERERERAWF